MLQTDVGQSSGGVAQMFVAERQIVGQMSVAVSQVAVQMSVD